MSKGKLFFCTILVMALWGFLFPMVKLGYQAYDITSVGDILYFAGVRFTICGGAICMFSGAKDRKIFVPLRSVWIPVLLSGVFSIILHYGFTYIGMSLTDSSETAILKQVGVLFYICFSSQFFKDDRLTMRKLAGAVLGLVGIAVINYTEGGIGLQIGDVLIICASFCIAISNVISKKVFEVADPVMVTGCSQLLGGIVLWSAGWAMGGSMEVHFDSSALIIVCICAASIVSYCIWYTVVKSEQLSKLFIIKFAEPVFACIFAALLIGENILEWRYLIAFVLIAAGIIISQAKGG